MTRSAHRTLSHLGRTWTRTPATRGEASHCRFRARFLIGALGMPGVISGLHPGPYGRTVAEQPAKANRNGWRHRLALPQDVVKVLAGNAEHIGDLGLGSAGCRNHINAALTRTTKAARVRSRSSLRESLALLPQGLEFRLLFGDALRDQFFVRSAGVRGGLLDQLTEVVAY